MHLWISVWIICGKRWKIVNIKIIGVGKLKEKYFKAGIAEYAKRLGRFCKFQIVEVPDEKAPESLSQAEMDEVMAKEGTDPGKDQGS